MNIPKAEKNDLYWQSYNEFKNSDKRIHTTEDKIELLSFDHMLQHAKMTLGFAYELAMADL